MPLALFSFKLATPQRSVVTDQDSSSYLSHTAEYVPRREKLTEHIMIKSILGVVCAAAFLTGFAYTQTSTTDPASGAEMTGTIKEYTPGNSLVLETLAPSEPVQFKLGKNTTFADT